MTLLVLSPSDLYISSMAKFVTTTEISYYIERIVKDAKQFVLLVSPYLKIHDRLKKVIEDKAKFTSVTVYIVCKQKELKQDALMWLKMNPTIQTFFHDNLHAKCYLNESSAIMTSMNLYEFSMVNNIEFGALVERIEDEVNYNVLFDECNNLTDKAISKRLQMAVAKEFAEFDLASAMKESNETPLGRPKAKFNADDAINAI